jgi:hypothetical protein
MSLNLLPSEAKFQAQRIKIKGLINNFLWVIGGVWVLLLVLSFGWWFFLNFRVGQLNKKYQNKLTEYKSRIDEVALTQKVKYQAKVVAKVLNSRFEYGEAMDLVSKVFPEGIRIDDIQIKDDEVFELSGGTNNGVLMDDFEQKIAEINNGEIEGLSSAKIVKLDISPVKGWLFVVDLEIK